MKAELIIDNIGECKDLLWRAKAEEAAHIMIIKPLKKDRKLTQNNLWYHWINEYAKAKSWTHKHATSHMKYYYALPILRTNKKYNMLLSMFDAKADNVGSNRDLHFAYVLPMTSQLNITEMTDVLKNTKIDIESSEGIKLSTSEDLYYEALGIKR